MKTPDNKYVPCYPVQFFDNFEGVYVTEVSVLAPFGRTPWTRIWEDSCDLGFWIQTEGGAELFVLEDVKCDSGNEINTWIFRSAYDNKTMCKIVND